MDTPTPAGRVRWPVKVFVLFHAIFILIWSFPVASREAWVEYEKDPIPRTPQEFSSALLIWGHQIKNSPLRPYMASTGLWQYWDMFSPNPANLDYWIDAVITYQDGSKKIHKYPRMKELPLLQKYLKERYRKFTERSTMDDPDSRMRYPYFAQRLALEAFTDPNNPPVNVELRRHARRIQPPSKVTPDGYETVMFYDYVVDQAKLRADAKR